MSSHTDEFWLNETDLSVDDKIYNFWVDNLLVTLFLSEPGLIFSLFSMAPSIVIQL